MVSSVIIITSAVAVFGLLHSLVASLRIKALAEKWLGLRIFRFYRLAYNLITVVLLFLILGMVLTLHDRIIYIIPEPWVYIILVIQGVAALCAVWGISQTGLSHFLGFKQLKKAEENAGPTHLALDGFYHWMRHPAYTFSLIFMWLLPMHTVNTLTFDVAATLYILVGIYFEEKKLVSEFGQVYLDYQKRTPMLVPFLKK